MLGHRLYLIYIIAVACILSLSSCNNKEDAVRELESISADMRMHSSTYSDDDWNEKENELQELTEDMNSMDFTEEELRRIGKAKGEIAGYEAQRAVQVLKKSINNAANEAAGFVDGFMKTATSDSDEH